MRGAPGRDAGPAGGVGLVRIRRHRDIAEDDGADHHRADSWRDTETERGFLMALGRPATRGLDRLLVEAIDPHNQVLVMLSLVPWGMVSLIPCVVLRQSPNVALSNLWSANRLWHAESLGITCISLNFAVLARPSCGRPTSPARRSVVAGAAGLLLTVVAALDRSPLQ